MLKRFTLEFGAWEPDAALLEGKQAPEAKNIIPARRGYVPMKGLAPMPPAALPGAVTAACSLRLFNDSLHFFACTADSIFHLENGAWNEAASGSEGDGSNAEILVFGENVYALFGGALCKAAESGGSVSFSEVSDAAGGETMGILRDFLVLGRTADGPNCIRWSAINAPESWPTPGTDAAQAVQADMQAFPEGGRVQAIVGGIAGSAGGAGDGLIFLEQAIMRASYVGAPLVFQFDSVDRQHGCAAPRSPVVIGTSCVFLADDGWRITDGSGSKSLGAERIDAWFFRECASSRKHEVRGAHDTRQRLAFWSFASERAPAGLHDRLLMYNYILDQWTYAEVDTECLFPAWQPGFTLEELDQFGSLDALPFASLDDPALRPGSLSLMAFNGSHKLCAFNGPELPAVLETGEFGGQRMMLHGLRPLVDSAEALALPLYRTRQMDAERKAGQETRQNREGICHQHISASYFAALVNIPGNVNWSHAVGVEALYEEEGGM